MEETYEYSVGLDIGTTKIVAIVGRKAPNGGIEILGMGKSQSLGVNQGVIQNIEQTISSIRRAVEGAERISGVKIKRVTVGIAGHHIRSLQRSDYILRDNIEDIINEKDIEVLKSQVDKLPMLPGEEIIHVIPQEYKIDSQGDIYEPIGMCGSRIEANFHVVVGKISSIRNITRCVRGAGLDIESITLEPLASSDAVLKPEEREAGVALIDIGGGTTDIAIFKDNIIRHTCVIPNGGKIITEEIKEKHSIIEKHAEILKKKYGSAMPEKEKENTYVTIPGISNRPDKEISIKRLAETINLRLKEVIDLINMELKLYGASEQKKKLIAGIVLTGGGSNLKNIAELIDRETGFDTRIGIPSEYVVNDYDDVLKIPEYATAIGLLIESIRIKDRKESYSKVEEYQQVDEVKNRDMIETTGSDVLPAIDAERDTHDEQDVSDVEKKNILSFLKKGFQQITESSKKWLNLPEEE